MNIKCRESKEKVEQIKKGDVGERMPVLILEMEEGFTSCGSSTRWVQHFIYSSKVRQRDVFMLRLALSGATAPFALHSSLPFISRRSSQRHARIPLMDILFRQERRRSFPGL